MSVGISSLDEACTVFDDPLALTFADEEHSMSETREIVVGQSVLHRLLIVCFTEPVKDRLRIISARCATRRETRDYEDYIQS